MKTMKGKQMFIRSQILFINSVDSKTWNHATLGQTEIEKRQRGMALSLNKSPFFQWVVEHEITHTAFWLNAFERCFDQNTSFGGQFSQMYFCAPDWDFASKDLNLKFFEYIEEKNLTRICYQDFIQEYEIFTHIRSVCGYPNPYKNFHK